MGTRKKYHQYKSAKISSSHISSENYDEPSDFINEEENENEINMKKNSNSKREQKNYSSYTPEVYQDYESEYYSRNFKRSRKKSSR